MISLMNSIGFKQERPLVETLLARYEQQIGQDFLGYRNHVYRTITYASFGQGLRWIDACWWLEGHAGYRQVVRANRQIFT